MKLDKNILGRLSAITLILIFISAFTMCTNTDTSANADTNEKIADDNSAMIADWKWAKEFTLAYIESMPETGINFKPTDSVRSFAEQMLHITSANVGFTAQVTGLPPTIEDVRGLEKNESYKNKAALAEVVGKGYDYVIASLETTPSEKLSTQMTLFGQYEMTGAEAMQKAFIHQNHHRGQCAVYIRLAGGVPAQMKLL